VEDERVFDGDKSGDQFEHLQSYIL